MFLLVQSMHRRGPKQGEGWRGKNSKNPRVSFLSLMWALDSVKMFMVFDNIISSPETVKAETSFPEEVRERSRDIFRTRKRLPLRMGKGWWRHRIENVISSRLAARVSWVMPHRPSGQQDFRSRHDQAWTCFAVSDDWGVWAFLLQGPGWGQGEGDHHNEQEHILFPFSSAGQENTMHNSLFSKLQEQLVHCHCCNIQYLEGKDVWMCVFTCARAPM